MPQARRFSELGVTADAPLEPLEPIGQLVRASAAASVPQSPPGVVPEEAGAPPAAATDSTAATGTSNARQA